MVKEAETYMTDTTISHQKKRSRVRTKGDRPAKKQKNTHVPVAPTPSLPLDVLQVIANEACDGGGYTVWNGLWMLYGVMGGVCKQWQTMAHSMTHLSLTTTMVLRYAKIHMMTNDSCDLGVSPHALLRRALPKQFALYDIVERCLISLSRDTLLDTRHALPLFRAMYRIEYTQWLYEELERLSFPYHDLPLRCLYINVRLQPGPRYVALPLWELREVLRDGPEEGRPVSASTQYRDLYYEGEHVAPWGPYESGVFRYPEKHVPYLTSFRSLTETERASVVADTLLMEYFFDGDKVYATAPTEGDAHIDTLLEDALPTALREAATILDIMRGLGDVYSENDTL